MSGSGKQILNKILDELSTRITSEDSLSEATDALRAGLLYRGSTASETFELVSMLKWGSDIDEEDGDLLRQGIVTGKSNHFISDIFETIIENVEIQKFVLKQYPDMSVKEYDAAMFSIWLLISSQQMFTECLSVESSNIDLKKRVKNMMRHYHHYFLEKESNDENCE